MHLENLRDHVNHCFSIARHRKRHGDVISEDPAPSFGTMALLLGDIAPAARPLKPIRIPRKTVRFEIYFLNLLYCRCVFVQVVLKDGQDVKVMISVVRAYDVPIRKEHDPMQSSSNLQSQGSTSTIRDGLREAAVSSFVEVKFQGHRSRTSCAPGPNPAWNQELVLKFKSANNDFSSDTLNRVRDYIHLNLFDEVSVDLLEEESERSTHVHQRFDRRWLGSLSIPFASLYHNTQIEGTFRLHSPAVLLGYERTGHHHHHQSNWRESDGGSQQDATFLNVYVTLEPPLSVPEPVKEQLDCAENEDVQKHCERWKRDLSAKYPTRVVR